MDCCKYREEDDMPRRNLIRIRGLQRTQYNRIARTRTRQNEGRKNSFEMLNFSRIHFYNGENVAGRRRIIIILLWKESIETSMRVVGCAKW